MPPRLRVCVHEHAAHRAVAGAWCGRRSRPRPCAQTNSAQVNRPWSRTQRQAVWCLPIRAKRSPPAVSQRRQLRAEVRPVGTSTANPTSRWILRRRCVERGIAASLYRKPEERPSIPRKFDGAPAPRRPRLRVRPRNVGRDQERGRSAPSSRATLTARVHRSHPSAPHRGHRGVLWYLVIECDQN